MTYRSTRLYAVLMAASCLFMTSCSLQNSYTSPGEHTPLDQQTLIVSKDIISAKSTDKDIVSSLYGIYGLSEDTDLRSQGMLFDNNGARMTVYEYYNDMQVYPVELHVDIPLKGSTMTIIGTPLVFNCAKTDPSCAIAQYTEPECIIPQDKAISMYDENADHTYKSDGYMFNNKDGTLHMCHIYQNEKETLFLDVSDPTDTHWTVSH